MSGRPLDVLIALSEEGAASATAAALRRRGHRVSVCAPAAVDRAPHVDDALVCDLPTLERLRAEQQSAPALLVDLETTPEAFRAALRLGATEVLTRPWLLSELADRVEACAAARTTPPRPDELRLDVEADPDRVEDALRELAAFLVARAVCPTTRTRALSACAEVLDNVLRHAYPLGVDGRAALRARLEQRDLRVSIADRGAGFDAPAVAHAAQGGLARARALAEELRVDSRTGAGTRVELDFVAWRVDFDEDDTIDLSELDWLPPALARRVLESLTGAGSEPLYNLSPALAVTVGRLLTGATPRQRAERALWS